jgi:N-acetylglucosamine kinase-like BadF-type ATPase
MHVIGIDAGGTKTVCLLADASGRIVGEARGEGANLQAAGELAVEKVLHRVMDEALGTHPFTPRAICLGIAGVDREDDLEVIRSIMRRIGFKARVLVVNDALVALVAGADDDPGIVIIAGTGSIAYGRNREGRAARAGGWGYVLGDEGSGYWMGRLALRAVVRQADRRGPPTQLTPLILSHFDVSDPTQLIHEVYYRPLPPPAIASLARYVQVAGDGGDPVALGIIDGAARELVASAASVATELDLLAEPFPFVLAGGMFRAVPRLGQELTRQLTTVAPAGEVRPLHVEPAMGAIHLALAEAAGRARVPSYRRA